MSAEFTIPGERKEPPQIVFRAPGKAGQRINMWCIFVGAKADYEELQLLAPGSPFAGNLMPFPPTVDRLSDRPSALTRAVDGHAHQLRRDDRRKKGNNTTAKE